jgi:uncharacterized protein YjcR
MIWVHHFGGAIMEITYTRQGDYYLPNLTLPEQPQVELGMYAQLRRRYLENQHKILYYNLLTKCKLVEHLADIEQQAFDMEERIIRQMAKQQGVTEALKAQDQMLWVARMNNIRNAAREIVCHELIYTV